MGVLDRFERGIERAVNGAFAKAFRAEVQPVELAGALRREADARAAVVSRGRTLTANSFTIELSENDYERFDDLSQALSGELRQVVGEHAASQGYSFVGPVTISFESVGDLDTGMYRIRSTTQRPDGSPAAQPASRGGYDPSVAPRHQPESGFAPPAGYALPAAPSYTPPAPSGYPAAGVTSAAVAAGAAAAAGHGVRPPRVPTSRRPSGSAGAAYGNPPANIHQQESAAPEGHAETVAYQHPYTGQPEAYVEVDGVRHVLTKFATVFGRSAADADISLDDPGVSRRHFEIQYDGNRASAVDLGSTNGTFIHGQRITKVALTSGAVLTAGRSSIVFHIDPPRGR